MAGGLIAYLREVYQNEIIVRLVASTVILIISVLILYVVRKLLTKLKSSRIAADTRSIDNLYKLIKSAILIITLFLILYILTMQQVIVYFILGIILIILAASWEIISNISAYYIILLTHRFGKGDLIDINGVVFGQIQEINPIYTFIMGDDGLYAVPNVFLIRRAARIPREPVYMTLDVRVWGIDDPESAKLLRQRLESEIPGLVKSITTRPKHFQAEAQVLEVTSDSITLRFSIPLPGPKPNPKKLSRLAEDLAVILNETGYSYSIILRPPGE